MKRTKPDPDEARQFLGRYLPAKTRAELLQTRLQRLQDRASGPRGPHLDGLPGAPRGTVGDPTGGLAQELIDTEDELREATATRDQIKAEIRRELNALPRESETDERIVMLLRARYFDGELWSGINEILFGGEDDFEDEDRKESYLRRCHKLHHKALYELSKILMEDIQ